MPQLDTTFDSYRVLFLTGSQHLYGPETLAQVAGQSRAIRCGPAATLLGIDLLATGCG